MDADYEIFEIVAVIHDHWLIDAESYQRRYSTQHGQPLTPGYYVVNWPDAIQSRRFNEQAAFHGPFTLRQEAQTARDWMRQEREYILTKPSKVSSITTPNCSRVAVKKTTSKKLRSLKSVNAKQSIASWEPWISEFPIAESA